MIIKVLFGESELIILCAIRIATLKYEQVSELLIDNFSQIIDRIMSMCVCVYV